MEFNDMGTNVLRDHTGQVFAQRIIDQFDEMLDQSRKLPLVRQWRCTPSFAANRFACAPYGAR
jgi:hypothetical protein